MDPKRINIFIGTEPKTEIARKVLEYSIISQSKYAKHIDFHPMMGEGWTDKAEAAFPSLGTGFSLLRWSIPEQMNYEGSAIYLDADIICLGDIIELYKADAKYGNVNTSTWCCYGKHKWFKRQETPETSVMLIDCAKAKTQQPSYDDCVNYVRKGGRDRTNYMRVMRALKHNPLPQEIPGKFNSLNKLQDNTLLLHYTNEPEQPWYNPDHQHSDVWEKYLVEAIQHDHVTKKEVQAAIDNYTPHGRGKRGCGMHPKWAKVL